jgi:hypothetical protein
MRFFCLLICVVFVVGAVDAMGSDTTYVHPKPRKVKKHKAPKRRTITA